MRTCAKSASRTKRGTMDNDVVDVGNEHPHVNGHPHPNGINGNSYLINGADGDSKSNSSTSAPYVVSSDHIHKKRSMRVICIGAGIAGIAAAYKYHRRLTDACTFVIYEKNHDVGGTWLENRYPGCACE